MTASTFESKKKNNLQLEEAEPACLLQPLGPWCCATSRGVFLKNSSCSRFIDSFRTTNPIAKLSAAIKRLAGVRLLQPLGLGSARHLGGVLLQHSVLGCDVPYDSSHNAMLARAATERVAHEVALRRAAPKAAARCARRRHSSSIAILCCTLMALGYSACHCVASCSRTATACTGRWWTSCRGSRGQRKTCRRGTRRCAPPPRTTCGPTRRSLRPSCCR